MGTCCTISAPLLLSPTLFQNEKLKKICRFWSCKSEQKSSVFLTSSQERLMLFVHKPHSDIESKSVVLKLNHASDHLVGWLKHLQSFWFTKSGWGLRIFISNRFPDEADVDELETVFMFLKGSKKFRKQVLYCTNKRLYVAFNFLQNMDAESQTLATRCEAFKRLMPRSHPWRS